MKDVDLTEILLQDSKFLHLPPGSKFSESVPYFVSHNPCEQLSVLKLQKDCIMMKSKSTDCKNKNILIEIFYKEETLFCIVWLVLFMIGTGFNIVWRRITFTVFVG